MVAGRHVIIVGIVSPNATRIYTFRHYFFSLTAVIARKRQIVIWLHNVTAVLWEPKYIAYYAYDVIEMRAPAAPPIHSFIVYFAEAAIHI